MKKPYLARIAGIRNYFPEKRLTNFDLEKMVETTSDWILERTGISERRIGAAHETPAFMGAAAAKELLKELKVSADEIDLIIVATITADFPLPATACLIQNELGARNAFAYDLSAACSGYLYALETARAYIESGLSQKVLVVAAEKMSSIIDYTDRQTCIIFGDGAAATLVDRAPNEASCILDSAHRTDGSGYSCLFIPGGGSRKPLSEEVLKNRENFDYQEGRTVFKRAVTDMAEISLEVLKRNHLAGSDIKLFVPHQANIRIIDAAAERLALPKEKIALNIRHYGNTTAATIPTALRQSEIDGKVKKGDLVLLASFGAGFTWGATLLRF